MSAFDLLDERLRRAIRDVGYETPTPVQEQAIGPLLAGRDMIGCAQTGTGKTAAFLLPVLHRLCTPAVPVKPGHPHALVLSPTRELAAQTAQNHVTYAKYVRVHYAIVFGGVSQFFQVKDVQRGAEIVIATPGRLIDLMSQGVIYLDRVREFVLDEADRMLDMGFLPDVKRIASKLPADRHSMFFSATMSREIERLAGELVRDPVRVAISPNRPAVDRIRARVMFVEKGNKDALLGELLARHPEWRKVIVFARTRHGADRMDRKLRRSGVPVAAIHSDKTQNQRMRALDGFREGRVRVLVATDIASRGIDVPRVDLVVNAELPNETESYVHRIGRTARAGESGEAISFVSPEERGLLKAVERYVRQSLPVDRDHPFHSEAVETRAGGKARGGLPPAPWVAGRFAASGRRRDGSSRHGGVRGGSARGGDHPVGRPPDGRPNRRPFRFPGGRKGGGGSPRGAR